MGANVKNDWLGYLDRSASQIKNALLGRLTNSNPELTDHSDSNPFVIFVDMFSGIAEMLGYYIDNMAEEGFLSTASRRSSVMKHVKMLDYRIKAKSAESVDLTITFDLPVPQAFTISAGMYIDSTIGSIRFYSLNDVQVALGVTSVIIPIVQIATIVNAAFVNTNGQKNQAINLGTNYVHNSLNIRIDGIDYIEVTTFALSHSQSRHFIVDIGADGNAYAILGNGIKGKLETSSLPISVSFQTTLGPAGKVGAGQFNEQSLTLLNALPNGLAIESANTIFASSGGAGYEATEDVRTNAIQSIRTLDRAVNRRDHIDILEALPGVSNAELFFNCGKNIDLYIVPTGGGVPSTILLDQAQAEIEDKKMVATFPRVKPAGETYLTLIAEVTARKRKSVAETKAQVEAALIEFGTVTNQEINGAIRLSDIQALIDNLSNVDYVDLIATYTKPYARPLGHNRNLVWTNETRQASTAPRAWRLEHSSGSIRVFEGAVFQSEVLIGDQFISSDNAFTFRVQPGTYLNGDRWEFNTYAFLRNIQLTDFTIFKIRIEDIGITVFPASNTTL